MDDVLNVYGRLIRSTMFRYLCNARLALNWTTNPGAQESDRHGMVPISSASISSLALLQGPAETTPEYNRLEQDVGFSDRQLLGELISAYVIFRLDIGYTVTVLARFSQVPAREHYQAFKHVVRCLQRTKDWGLMYWRPEPPDSLPATGCLRKTISCLRFLTSSLRN